MLSSIQHNPGIRDVADGANGWARSKKRNVSQWITIRLIQENTEMTLLDLAERFQVGSYSAISTTVEKLNKLMGLDGKILAEYELLRAEITEK
ncbi:hypothetical protein AB833_05175 [Chromatiales bacterium (ex Bugula neritina AB1)]|nr:hypothetical protein AB833_05175 [Chromatiales bacterium (ex Bugula neritina AB1)]